MSLGGRVSDGETSWKYLQTLSGRGFITINERQISKCIFRDKIELNHCFYFIIGAYNFDV